MFAYCFNNPINLSDPTGNWPKWVTGTLNAVSGITQVISGVALASSAGWTGIGAVAGGALIINGIAATVSGVTQVINSVTNKNHHEENYIRTGAKKIGKTFGGERGEKIGAATYDVFNVAATIYSIAGGSVTTLTKTVNILSKNVKISSQTFTMLKSSKFMNEYALEIGSITRYVQLPKPWFRTVNGVGAGTDSLLTIDNLINIFKEET